MFPKWQQHPPPQGKRGWNFPCSWWPWSSFWQPPVLIKPVVLSALNIRQVHGGQPPVLPAACPRGDGHARRRLLQLPHGGGRAGEGTNPHVAGAWSLLLPNHTIFLLMWSWDASCGQTEWGLITGLRPGCSHTSSCAINLAILSPKLSAVDENSFQKLFACRPYEIVKI